MGGYASKKNLIGLLAWCPTHCKAVWWLCGCMDTLVRLSWWLGLGTSQQDGTYAYIACCLETQSRVCIEFLGQVRPLVLLCRWGEPPAVVSLQVPLYVELLNGLHSFLCALAYVLWWDRLKTVFSNEQGYELESLPVCSGRSCFKTSKTLCCLKSSWPTLQVW